MRRREVIALAAGTAALWPFAARARQEAMPVVGFLDSTTAGSRAPDVAAFRQGLSGTGYVEGQNLAIEYRWAEGSYERLPALAADLVARKIDLIVTGGGSVVALAAKAATSTIPVVFISGDDPVELGLVTSLARPGGNFTGVSLIFAELTAKRLELLSELVPEAKVIALLVNPGNPNAERIIGEVREGARVGLQLHVFKASSESEIDIAFAALAQLHAGALLVGNDGFFGSRRDQIAAAASSRVVPAIYDSRQFAVSGGLISYGPSLTAAYRQLGIYAGRVLKGAKPADLPVQQPAKFELVINLKTAKTLGLTVPQSLLARADEVIE